jgi:hypothetical protein
MVEYTIQDKSATKPEYFVALALERLKIEYVFQYIIGGGRRTAGGYVLDFLALTVPLFTPIQVYGEYWHNRKAHDKDKLQLALLQSYLGVVTNEAIELWADKDLPDEETAYKNVRKSLLL